VTVDEWAGTALLLLRRWPGQSLDTDVLGTWYELLADLPGEAVHGAVRGIALTSRQFVPNPGDIRQAVADLAQPQVTFEQAWSEISRAISAAGRYAAGNAERMLRQVPGAWDLVLAMGGWDEICHGGPIEQPPVPAGVRRAAAEHAWKALREQRHTDIAATPLSGPAGDVARRRVATGGMQRIAVPPLPESTVDGGLPPPPDGPPAVPALPPPNREQLRDVAKQHVGNNGARLKAEYRAQIEQMLRSGQEAQIPERWRQYVAEIKAAMDRPA
jgi:hypothetical protein